LVSAKESVVFDGSAKESEESVVLLVSAKESVVFAGFS
jgi:hypothetical protein